MSNWQDVVRNDDGKCSDQQDRRGMLKGRCVDRLGEDEHKLDAEVG